MKIPNDTEQTLLEVLRFFVHRDAMNAAIHCSEVRYSPITFRIAEAIVREFPAGLPAVDIDVRTVLSHVGTYEEDQGR